MCLVGSVSNEAYLKAGTIEGDEEFAKRENEIIGKQYRLTAGITTSIEAARRLIWEVPGVDWYEDNATKPARKDRKLKPRP